MVREVSASLVGRWREIAVTHSPGLIGVSGSTLAAGTWTLKVTYGWSYATNSTGDVKGSFHVFDASCWTAREIASA